MLVVYKIKHFVLIQGKNNPQEHLTISNMADLSHRCNLPPWDFFTATMLLLYWFFLLRAVCIFRILDTTGKEKYRF